MTSEWQVDRTSGTCAVSGRQFAEGDEFYAVLFDRGDHFERLDYSLPCWDGPPAGAYCFWKSRVPQREKKRRLLVDDEVLVSFFSRLAEDDEPTKRQFRFVLALILMRKRLLKYEQTVHEDDSEIWLMRLKSRDELHRVVNPQLGEHQIGEVSRQLGAILHEDTTAFIVLDEQS
jgi:hypothetical protein